MKRLVASEMRVTVVTGIVAGLAIAFTRPGPDGAFLIAAVVAAIGLFFIFGPDWRESRRERRRRRER